MTHTIDDNKVTLKQLDAIPQGYTEDIYTIVVRGDVKGVGEEALELFFTNPKKCGGGEIVSIKIESDTEAFITFQDSVGMYNHMYVICICVYSLAFNVASSEYIEIDNLEGREGNTFEWSHTTHVSLLFKQVNLVAN